MTDYYSLGLEKRDRVNHAVGGGIPTGSIMLLEGPDGTGKSVWTQRIAYGVAEEGTSVTYVSTELDSAEYINQMASLSYDVVDHLLDNTLLFLNADMDTHTQVDGKAYGERELLSRFRTSEVMWKNDVIIIDEFSAMLLNDPAFDKSTLNEDEDHAMQSILSFLKKLTSQGKTIILTVDDESVTDRSVRPLRDNADIYFQIETSQVGQEIRHNTAVRRFREMQAPVDDNIGFSVQQGRGITIESRTIA